MTLHKIKKEGDFFLRSCCIGAERTSLFMAEQVILLVGEGWCLYNIDTQCRVRERGE